MATLTFDDGIATSGFSTRCALRMRVSMSAMGSLMLMCVPRLPAGLGQAWDVTAHRGLTDLGAREPELAERATRPARQRAAVAQARRTGIARQCLQALHRVHALVHRARLVGN